MNKYTPEELRDYAREHAIGYGIDSEIARQFLSLKSLPNKVTLALQIGLNYAEEASSNALGESNAILDDISIILGAIEEVTP